MNKSFRTSVVLMIAGIAAICVGIFFNISGNKQKARDTEPAAAVFVRYEEDTDYNSSSETYDTVYYPVFSYEVNGKTIESRYSQSSFTKDYKDGDTVNIKYNPDKPEEFILDGDKSSVFNTVWEVSLGAILFIVGLVRILVPLIAVRKSKKEEISE